MPRVSVIIPTYNRAHLIQRALDSLLQQTFQDFEILIIDDGSSDHTRAALAPYAGRIRYVYQQNAGVSAARNHGIRLAQGELLAFLDSDDLVLPDKLAFQVAYLDQHPEIDIVYGGWQILDEDEGTPRTEIRPAQSVDVLEKLLWDGYYFPIHAALMRRSCIERAGMFDETIAAFEDPDFWLRMALAGCKFGCTPEPVCLYIMTRGSLGKNIPKLEQSLPVVLEKAFNYPALPARLAALKDSIYVRRYLEFGIAYYELDDSDTPEQWENLRRNIHNALARDPQALNQKTELFDLVAHKAIKLSPQNPEAYVRRILAYLLAPSPGYAKALKRTLGKMHIILAFQAYQNGQNRWALNHVVRGLRHDPAWILNRGVVSIGFQSLFAVNR